MVLFGLGRLQQRQTSNKLPSSSHFTTSLAIREVTRHCTCQTSGLLVPAARANVHVKADHNGQHKVALSSPALPAHHTLPTWPKPLPHSTHHPRRLGDPKVDPRLYSRRRQLTRNFRHPQELVLLPAHLPRSPRFAHLGTNTCRAT